ncbi:ABC transporter permease [Ornithinimicrobium cryptoxanthini]|uniref:ABC transporter permease n=1 Tax=Ornithinimicrobium cryptoxanthini TaxID=2934161 RepID=A0ABY4YMY0_9MICO|nr:ABC transporter permease [Ornithinimicrobium cryptoxanthini]USQ78083.1 ABC transporter permease [Ornithinimicrobium cryptoxanthini]
MLRVSLRNLLSHKLRLLLTVAAVTIGVAFVSGTFVLSDTMNKAFDELFSGIRGNTDVVVRSASAYDEPAFQGEARPLDQGLVDTVAAVPGVAVAEGSVTGFALILDKDGAPIQPGGAPTLGTSVSASTDLTGAFTYRDGRPPQGLGEVTIDARSAEGAGYDLGDEVDIVLADGGAQTFTLVAVTGFGDSDSLAGATLAGFDLPTAQQVLGKSGQVDEIAVLAESDVRPEDLRSSIADVLPPGTEALSGAEVAGEQATAMQDGLAVFSQVLLVFAAVALLVGSFVIWNTFNVLVAQRRREIALLRAVGATRRQVLSGILLESEAIGLLASALGILAGMGLAIGIRQLLVLIGIEVPTTAVALEPRTVIAALAVGVGVTTLAAAVPGWAATRIAPIEALRDSTPTTDGIRLRRRIAGPLVLGAGVLGLVASAVVGDEMMLTALASLTAFVGLVLAGPSLAQGTARIAGHGRRGGSWRMAARNIARAPRRAAATALALTIGVTVVAAVTVTATSMGESVQEVVAGSNRADFILTRTGAGISPAAAATLRDLEALDAVVALKYAGAQVEGTRSVVAALDPSDLELVMDVGDPVGVIDLSPGAVVMGTREAASHGVEVGDTVTVTFPETGEVTLTLTAIVGEGPTTLIGSAHWVSLEDFAANVTSTLDGSVLVSAAPGADLVATEQLIGQRLADHPNVVVNDPAELVASNQASVDQLLGVVTALLLLAVVIAVLGIVNTLVLSVLERTRELGLMRAVGATRRQVRAIVRRESVLMAMLGAVTGIALGTLVGVAISRSLGDEGITQVSVPVAQLAGYLLVAAAVGIIAAIAPARRASKVDVLRAVVQE